MGIPFALVSSSTSRISSSKARLELIERLGLSTLYVGSVEIYNYSPAY